jgi:alpha-beta hydrolase superfamily lysophospholipase
MINRLVIPVHGIHNSRRKARAWTALLAARLAGPGVLVAPYLWGWLPALAIKAPWIAGWTERHYVTGLQRFARELKAENTGADLCLVGHSYGTQLSYGATGDEFGPGLKCARLVLMASIVSARERLADLKAHAGRLLNLWSPEDEVVKFSTIGLSGWQGFRNADGKQIVNLEMSKYEHADYEAPGPAWEAAAAFLTK